MKRFTSVIIAGALLLCACPALTSCEEEKSLEDMTDEELEQYFEDAFAALDDSYTDENEEETTTEPQPKEIEPFKDIELVCTGISPYVKISSASFNNGDKYVNYAIDESKDYFSNGDVVTVTAELVDDSLEDYYFLSETEKEFTIEDMPEYVQSIDDIPQDAYDKMDQTLRDAYTAKIASYTDGRGSIDIELLGNYMLTSKTNSSGTVNYLYFVYKIKGEFPKSKEETASKDDYYDCFYYTDVIILPDGTCSLDYSDYTADSSTLFSIYSSSNFGGYQNISGYEDLDVMFNKCVTAKIDMYNYENTVVEPESTKSDSDKDKSDSDDDDEDEDSED